MEEMRDIILGFSQQFKEGIESAKDISLTKSYERIITCGMGGSAIPGEILSIVKNNLIVHWDYDLPVSASNKDLVICTSWSGNTEETISSYEKALVLGIDALVITKGGNLAEKARANQAPLIILPSKDIQPRTAVGYMVGAMFKALSLENLLELQINANTEKQGQELAEKIGSKIPLIYSSFLWRKLAGFWKILFNENAKIPAFANWMPNMAHNEIAAFSDKQQATRSMLYPIVIQDDGDDPRHIRTINALLAIFDKMRYNYSIVKLTEGKPLEKVFNNYVFGLWTSYYLAKILGIDPEDTELIEKFKQQKNYKL